MLVIVTVLVVFRVCVIFASMLHEELRCNSNQPGAEPLQYELMLVCMLSSAFLLDT